MELDSEVLEVADTRPVLMMGVPLELALLIIFGGFAVNNQLHSLIMGPAIAVPLWIASSFLVRKDYNYIRVFLIWFRTSAMSADAQYFGGASVSPFPIKTKRFRGIW